MELMRTTLELDKNLFEEAIELASIKSKKGVVEMALKEFVERRKQKNLFDIRGKVDFLDDYDYKKMRAEDEAEGNDGA